MQIFHVADLAVGLPASLSGPVGGLGYEGVLYALWGINLVVVALGTLFVLRHVLGGVPKDIAEAARIDGCGFWGVYWHVTLPAIKPALGLIGFLVVMAMCDDAVGPLIEGGGVSPAFYAYHATARGVSIGVGIFGLLMAGLLLLIPPVLAMFCQARRQSQ
jgi:ABC-type glycerol-3-phosphate transport system permease component